MLYHDTTNLKHWLRTNSSGVYRQAAEAADVIDGLEAEVRRLRRVALYLADCHAANGEGYIKSESAKKRIASICTKAVLYLSTFQSPPNPLSGNEKVEADWVLKRCAAKANQLLKPNEPKSKP